MGLVYNLLKTHKIRQYEVVRRWMKTMRKGSLYAVLVSIIIIFFSINIGFAADAMYRLMHNDHDALIIGRIIAKSENEIKIEVVKQIISSKNLSAFASLKQIPLKGTIRVIKIHDYNLHYNTNSSEKVSKIGDNVLVSLIKKGDDFAIGWGIFKLNSMEYSTLKVLYPNEASKYVKMEAAALTAFVNSNGKENEFSFDGDTGKVYSRGKVIYDASTVAATESNDSELIMPLPHNATNTENTKLAVPRIEILIVLATAGFGVWILIRVKKKQIR